MTNDKMWLAPLLALMVIPAYAHARPAIQTVLAERGLPAPVAARLATQAQAHYSAARMKALVSALKTVPALPTSHTATSDMGAEAAMTKVLTQAFALTLPASRVAAAAKAVIAAVQTGARPAPTAQLVITGLKDGLRGPALTAVARGYCADIHRGATPPVAYRTAMRHITGLHESATAGMKGTFMSGDTEQSLVTHSGVMAGSHAVMGGATGAFGAMRGAGATMGGSVTMSGGGTMSRP
ncbi:MAG: hypothetical protein M0Z76_10160 [Gammaproteobacteria bacterium]|nr:hypothetical protein [Gammaproteobacteria bacterium]